MIVYSNHYTILARGRGVMNLKQISLQRLSLRNDIVSRVTGLRIDQFTYYL